MLKLSSAAILILSAVLAHGAQAAAPTGGADDYGVAAAPNTAGRTISVQPGAKYLNVTNGETVNISIAGKNFAWNVNTFPSKTVFDLSEIAPKDVPADGIKVYVADNPLYSGS
ncbi:CzcE family metal-binding protein [Janthinobacterium agaricidamnosum]|uniref:Uncharacterized domain protein n=1 Tax=Janthinobacterium agaricidamnosum NBRC 102515 = DSM 9628 TaxID=1349767 RepID=W0V0H0_9BURK|nr:CzcE family metal-binding protein [Janthinobacterium agaricidamnosum]CDG80782.1 putative uncharacterized domain protein [Janthinobacterium agaricidamnosum NBRC 102515 = DSM 9628]